MIQPSFIHLLVLGKAPSIFQHPRSSMLRLGCAYLALIALGACANPGASYVRQHPDLPPKHRQILERREIPPGDAVAGMTREQVKIAMGSEPATYEKMGDEDVWIFIRKQGIGRESFDDMHRSGGSRLDNTRSFTQSDDFSPRTDIDVKTTVFFQGDLATRATVVDEPQ